ncbi:MAG: FimB/Mfa2 family fimbrial subunit, partial [Tannerellaceae bacterium]|nr:FimB/Mfa2 family fimbrial subunit [Tannerellaceae bacterium]
MKRHQTHLPQNALAAVCLLLLSVSCLKEDNDNCRATIRLHFTYTFNPEYTDLFTGHVNDLFLYFFDANEVYHKHIPIDATRLEPSNTLTLEIEEGDYKIIAIGNPDPTSYQLDPAPGMDKPGVTLIKDTNGEIPPMPTDLFYGAATLTVTPNTDQTIEIPMVRDTNNINILLAASGSSETPSGSGYTVRITSSNGAINFENNTVPLPAIYKPVYSETEYKNAPYHQAYFKIFKLALGDDTTIELYRDGNLEHSDKVVPLITENFPKVQTNEDLLRYCD